MKRKNLYLCVLAATLLGAGTAQGATLEDSIRAQALDASTMIREEMRTDLHATPYVLDVPGVEIGDIKLVDSDVRPDPEERARSVLETTSMDLRDALRRDLVIKALSAPGMFGVYRYLSGYAAESALKAAITVAE